MLVEIFVLFALTVLNGVLAMSELAIVSSRPTRLAAMAEKGNRGAAMAIELRANPGRFLSAVQIGITLVGILSGAVSGATLGLRLTETFRASGMSEAIAAPLGVGIVVGCVTYLSLVIGELVPKQIAMANPEAVSTRIAPPLTLLARIMTPFVWLLDGTSKLVLGLLRVNRDGEQSITDEEVRMTIAEATQAGVLLPEERGMIAGVMRVADRSARAMMTPRRDIVMVDVNDPPKTIIDKARQVNTSRIVVCDGSSENVLGVVALRDLLARGAMGRLRELVIAAPVVQDDALAMSVVEELRETPARMVFVYDEEGHFEGVISTMDLLEAIAGDFSEGEDDEPDMVRRADGSWLVSGSENADEFAGETHFPLPSGDFTTVAGLVLALLERLPRTGEVIDHDGWRIEVVDLDGMRIDRLIVTPPLVAAQGAI